MAYMITPCLIDLNNVHEFVKYPLRMPCWTFLIYPMDIVYPNPNLIIVDSITPECMVFKVVSISTCKNIYIDLFILIIPFPHKHTIYRPHTSSLELLLVVVLCFYLLTFWPHTNTSRTIRLPVIEYTDISIQSWYIFTTYKSASFSIFRNSCIYLTINTSPNLELSTTLGLSLLQGVPHPWKLILVYSFPFGQWCGWHMTKEFLKHLLEFA